MLRKRRFWIVIILTVFLGYLVSGEINFAKLKDLFREANPSFLFLAILFAFLSFWVKSASWYVLMRPVKKRAGIHRLFSSLMIGYTVESALGGPRLRELVRIYAASDSEDVKFFSSFATVVVNRAIDGIVLALYVIIVTGFFFTLPPSNNWSIKIAWSTGVSSLVFLAFLYFLRDEKSRANSVIKKILQWLLENRYEAGLEYYRDFIKGLGALKKWQPIFFSLLFAIVARGITAGYFWSLGKSLGVSLSASASSLLTGITSMRIFIPPYFIMGGTPQFHDLLGWNLRETFHLSHALAASYGPPIIILTSALTVGIGLLCLFLEAFRRRRARRSA